MPRLPKVPKQKEAWTTIKVLESTKSYLIQLQSLQQIKEGKRISMDDVIRGLAHRVPSIELTLKAVRERQA